MAMENFSTCNQKLQNAATSAADFATREDTITTTQLGDIYAAVQRIVAPFDGVTGSRMVTPGEWIKPEITGFVQLTAIDMLQLIFTIPEPNIALARIDGKIHARVVAFPDERFPGDVYFISPTLDPATRRLIVKAWVPNADRRLKPVFGSAHG